ncbi:MAG: hypothetical protein ACRDRH_29140 [Pseudonocardia sp.]
MTQPTTVTIDNIEVDKRGGMPTWDQGSARYHINLHYATLHVTEESEVKIQYYFSVNAGQIDDALPEKEERGGRSTVKRNGKTVHTKQKFSALPGPVQAFIRRNYIDLIS